MLISLLMASIVKGVKMQEIKFACYDPTRRKWVVVHPESEAEMLFDSGKDGQRQAKRAGLYLIAKSYHDMAEELAEVIPEYESRIWKAAFYAAENRVDYRGQPTRHGLVALVEGNDPDGPYTITAVERLRPETWSCSCPDFQLMYAPFTPAGHRMCKHMIATLMYFTVEYDSRTWPDIVAREKDVLVPVS